MAAAATACSACCSAFRLRAPSACFSADPVVIETGAGAAARQAAAPDPSMLGGGRRCGRSVQRPIPRPRDSCHRPSPRHVVPDPYRWLEDRDEPGDHGLAGSPGRPVARLRRGAPGRWIPSRAEDVRGVPGSSLLEDEGDHAACSPATCSRPRRPHRTGSRGVTAFGEVARRGGGWLPLRAPLTSPGPSPCWRSLRPSGGSSTPWCPAARSTRPRPGWSRRRCHHSPARPQPPHPSGSVLDRSGSPRNQNLAPPHLRSPRARLRDHRGSASNCSARSRGSAPR
jgi:hypothetical protein